MGVGVQCEPGGKVAEHMEEAAFDVWSEEASTRRKQYEAGDLTPEAFKAWIDETSYQDKK